MQGILRGAEGGGAELSPSHGSSGVIFCLSCHVTPSAKGKKKKKEKTCWCLKGSVGEEGAAGKGLQTPRERKFLTWFSILL